MIKKEIQAIEKISRLLKADSSHISAILAKLEAVSGQKQLPLKIINQIESKIEIILKRINASERKTEKIYPALDKEIKNIVEGFYSQLDFKKDFNWQKISQLVLEKRKNPSGLFLKTEKLKKLILKHPPEILIKDLNYKDAKELVEKEDIFEIAAALRFVQGGEWLNKEFLPDYKIFKPEDFEERPIIIKPLSKKWQKYDKEFIKKKFHNVSHLKELGLIFILPRNDYNPFIFFMDFALLFHYLREIEFFNGLLKDFIENRPQTWQMDFVKSISGLVPEKRPEIFQPYFFILSRYLEKLEIDMWQKYWPHLNSETLHWVDALYDLSDLLKSQGFEQINLWEGSNWLGEFFLDDNAQSHLISFSFIDNFFSLAHNKQGKGRYFYHFEEALWNYLFISAFGQETLRKTLQKNWLKGRVKI